MKYESYLNSGYVSASEALWQIYDIPIHENYPAVKKLLCYVPNEQSVIFEETKALEAVQQGPSKSN